MRCLVALIGVVGMALLSAACGASSGQPWAHEAERYYEVQDEVRQRTTAGVLRRFYAVDMRLEVFDAIACSDQLECTELLTDVFGDAMRYEVEDGLHLDLGTAVRQYHYSWGTADLAIEELDPHGRVAVVRHPVSIGDIELAPEWEPVAATARATAASYLRAWSSSDVDAVVALYAPDATITDSLAQVELAGREAIAGHARRAVDAGAPAALRLRELEPYPYGPAIYVLLPGGRTDVVEVYVAFDADDGSGCPGRSIAGLTVSEGSITQERRYHELGSVRRCWDTDRVPDGWWTGLDVPDPVEAELSGTVEVRGEEIGIRSGTPVLERLLRWALERFATAGLEPPAIHEVTFDAFAEPCQGWYRGYAIDVGDEADVFFCLSEDDALDDGGPQAFDRWARKVMLHELAHAWMFERVDAATQDEFVELMSLPAWYDQALPRPERGMEIAAEILAWGLMDERPRLDPFDGRACAQLLDGFRLLAGGPPLQAPCTGR